MGAYTGQPGIDWGSVAQGVGLETNLRQFEADQKAQAMRWQGQQDYETLVNSGVDAMEAMRRTAPKLFFNDPRGMANAIESISKPQPVQGTIETIGGVQFIRQPTGHLIQVNTAGSRPQERNVSLTLPMPGGGNVRENLSTEEYKSRVAKADLAAAQQQVDKGRIFGLLGPSQAAIAARDSASNVVRNLTLPAPAVGPVSGAVPMPQSITTAPPGTAPIKEDDFTNYEPVPAKESEAKDGSIYISQRGPVKYFKGKGYMLLPSSSTYKNKHIPIGQKIPSSNAGIMG